MLKKIKAMLKPKPRQTVSVRFMSVDGSTQLHESSFIPKRPGEFDIDIFKKLDAQNKVTGEWQIFNFVFCAMKKINGIPTLIYINLTAEWAAKMQKDADEKGSIQMIMKHPNGIDEIFSITK